LENGVFAEGIEVGTGCSKYNTLKRKKYQAIEKTYTDYQILLHFCN